MLSRRELLSSAASAALAYSVLPAFAAGSDSAARLNALMDTFFQENLNESPESATLLGFDKGANAGLKSKLRDESLAGTAHAKALNASQLARLKAIDASKLAGMDKVNYDTLLYVGESRAAIAAFDFGGAAFGPSPYVVSQLTGVYQSVPDFMDTKHKIETADDCDAYLSRLDAFAGQLDGDTERMKHDAALGVVPPDFLLDRSLEQMTAFRTAGGQIAARHLHRRAREGQRSIGRLRRRRPPPSTTPRSGPRWTARSRRRRPCARPRRPMRDVEVEGRRGLLCGDIAFRPRPPA